MLVIGPAEITPLAHPEYFFCGVCLWEGGGYIEVMFIFKNHVKISRPTSSCFSGKIKTEKQNICVYYIFQYSRVLVICQLRGGGGGFGSLPPPPGFANGGYTV